MQEDVFVSAANYIASLYSVCALVTNFRLRTFATGNESTIINHKQNFGCDTGFQWTFVISSNRCKIPF